MCCSYYINIYMHFVGRYDCFPSISFENSLMFCARNIIIRVGELKVAYKSKQKVSKIKCLFCSIWSLFNNINKTYIYIWDRNLNCFRFSVEIKSFFLSTSNGIVFMYNFCTILVLHIVKLKHNTIDCWWSIFYFNNFRVFWSEKQYTTELGVTL